MPDEAAKSEPGSSPVLDVSKTHVARELKHDSPLIACRFDPTGKYVFFAAQDNRVWRWEWSGEDKVELAAHDSWIRAIAFSPNGETIVTGGYDGRLIWWPAAADKPEPLRTIEAHDGWIRALAVDPSGKILASTGNDLLVKLWNLEDGSQIDQWSGHDCHVYNLAFHPSGDALVSGDLKANLIHWEVPSGKQVRQIKAESLHKYDKTFRADIGGFRGLAFSPDGSRLGGSGISNVTNAFAGIGNPAIAIFDWESGKQIIQHESKGKLQGVGWGLAFHPEQFTIGIVGGRGGGFILFWKPDEKEDFHRLKLRNSSRDMDLCTDNLHLVTAHYDRQVRVSLMSDKA